MIETAGHEWSHPDCYCCFWMPFFGGKLHKQLCLPGTTLNPYDFKKRGAPGVLENGGAPGVLEK